MRFTGTTVLITGAGRGIGAQTARRFGAEGANVIVTDLDAESATRVAASIAGALAIEVDVTSRKSLRQAVDETTERFGGVDILINNAMASSGAPFLQMSADQVHHDFAVNAIGPFFAIQEVIPGMIARGHGVILNVASVNGIAYYGNEAYSAAKAAVISLTTSIAARFGADGIRCNAVAPGTINTEAWDRRRRVEPHVLEDAARWYPLGRIGSTDDVAESLLFLASDAAAWITGAVLPVEGGLLAGNPAMARALTPTRSSEADRPSPTGATS